MTCFLYVPNHRKERRLGRISLLFFTILFFVLVVYNVVSLLPALNTLLNLILVLSFTAIWAGASAFMICDVFITSSDLVIDADKNVRLYLFSFWYITITPDQLAHCSIQIREKSIPYPASKEMVASDINWEQVYAIIVPGLPWMYHFISYVHRMSKPAFFITQFHSDYEVLLKEITSYIDINPSNNSDLDIPIPNS